MNIKKSWFPNYANIDFGLENFKKIKPLMNIKNFWLPSAILGFGLEFF
jgi:hypothetical protein